MRAFEFVLIIILVLVICSMATLNRWHFVFQTQWGSPAEQMATDSPAEHAAEETKKESTVDYAKEYSQLPVTRIEFIVILSRHLGLKPETGPMSFTDITGNSPTSRYVYPLVKRGYISGYSDKTLRPQEFITENEAKIIIARSQGQNAPAYQPNSPLLTKEQLFNMLAEVE